MKKCIPLRTAKNALIALNDAQTRIAQDYEGEDQKESWFAHIPSFERYRKALIKAIAKAEEPK